MDIERAHTGAPWEKKVGYCRAICAGNQVFVSGTAPVADDGGVFEPGNAYAQAKRCLEIISKTVARWDAKVVRTRMFVTDISRWEEIGRAHAECFGAEPPATSMVQVAALISPGMLVEIEADAVIYPPSQLC